MLKRDNKGFSTGEARDLRVWGKVLQPQWHIKKRKLSAVLINNVVAKASLYSLRILSLLLLLLFSDSNRAYSNPPSSSLHNKCLAAKDYKGCIEAQLPQKEIFSKAVAYDKCFDHMRSEFAAAAARSGDAGASVYLGYIPELCNESVQLQQQGYSPSSANSTAIANMIRRVQEQKRLRDDQYTRDLINAPNPYLPYIFGR